MSAAANATVDGDAPHARGGWRAIRGVPADIGDTISTDGRVTAQAVCGHGALRRAGPARRPRSPDAPQARLRAHIAADVPVDAVVGENGALLHDPRRSRAKLAKRYAASERADRQAARALVLASACQRSMPHRAGLRARVRPALPREADLAIDYR